MQISNNVGTVNQSDWRASGKQAASYMREPAVTYSSLQKLLYPNGTLSQRYTGLFWPKGKATSYSELPSTQKVVDGLLMDKELADCIRAIKKINPLYKIMPVPTPTDSKFEMTEAEKAFHLYDKPKFNPNSQVDDGKLQGKTYISHNELWIYDPKSEYAVACIFHRFNHGFWLRSPRLIMERKTSEFFNSTKSSTAKGIVLKFQKVKEPIIEDEFKEVVVRRLCSLREGTMGVYARDFRRKLEKAIEKFSYRNCTELMVSMYDNATNTITLGIDDLEAGRGVVSSFYADKQPIVDVILEAQQAKYAHHEAVRYEVMPAYCVHVGASGVHAGWIDKGQALIKTDSPVVEGLTLGVRLESYNEVSELPEEVTGAMALLDMIEPEVGSIQSVLEGVGWKDTETNDYVISTLYYRKETNDE